MAATIRQTPFLLTHSANPSKCEPSPTWWSRLRCADCNQKKTALRSVDGKVGALVHVPCGEYIVTSPNSNVVYVPPMGTCCVCMKKGFHFAEDDPMLYPQLYVAEVAYLSVIPRRPSPQAFTTDHPDSMAFYQPSDTDFLLKHPERPWLGLGHLIPSVTSELKAMVLSLHHTFRASIVTHCPTDIDTSVAKDERLHHYDLALQRLLQRLSLPSSRHEYFALVAVMQHVYLEFKAVLTWLRVYQDRFKSRVNPLPVEHVVGAFTDDLDVADALFYASILVWIVHPIQDLLKLRIDHACHPLPLTSAKLPIGVDEYLQVTDLEPSQIIFTGQPTDLSCYRAMSACLKSLTSTGVLTSPIISNVTRTVERPLYTGPPRLLNRSRQHVKKSCKYHFPFTSGLTPACLDNKETTTTLRNKFVGVDDVMAPESIPVWRNALTSLSHLFKINVADVNSGYAAPDPGLFLQPAKEEIWVHYFSVWLKLQELLFHRISSSSGTIEPLPNKTWRNLLSLGKTSPRADTLQGKLRSRVLLILQECASRSNTHLNFNDLSSLPATWQGQEIPSHQLPPTHVGKEILWELYEINFRVEFLALDSILDKSDEHSTERQIVIDGHCWPNSLVIPDFERSGDGLNARSLKDRAPYLDGLRLVMSSWSGAPLALREPFSCVDASEHDLEQMEMEIAQFYVNAFYRIFGRAANVPHFL